MNYIDYLVIYSGFALASVMQPKYWKTIPKKNKIEIGLICLNLDWLKKIGCNYKHHYILEHRLYFSWLVLIGFDRYSDITFF
jgi:hypothetical protein